MQKTLPFVLVCGALGCFFALQSLDWLSWSLPSHSEFKGVSDTHQQDNPTSTEHEAPSTNFRGLARSALDFNTAAQPLDVDGWLKSFQESKRRPNVLFMVADDMRPEIGAYVHKHSPWLEPGMVTPNLDTLAKGGVLFRRAYCQFSWCNPSRSSLLTSRRPDTTMVHNNSVYFRQNLPSITTLPQYFKDNGYLTLGMGKIFHLLNVAGDHDDEHSWSLPMYRPDGKSFYNEGPKAWEAVTDKERKGKQLLDENVLLFAKETLNSIARHKNTSTKPFFLAVGFKKPHLNWYFPERFMAPYLLHNISMPKNPSASLSLPGIAWFSSFEIRGRKEYKKETDTWGMTQPLASWVTRELRRAYYSSITYIDHLVGELLQHLQKVGLEQNTIVSFIGDHGFHLGEHSIVGKNTAFEVANNVPMIIRIPGVTDNGQITDKMAEFVDLFPTLAELAGLPKVPYCPAGDRSKQVNTCTEGTSLVPLIKQAAPEKWKDSAFYQYPHYLGYASAFCMGYSMRTAQYRYTEWVDYNYNAEPKANWTHLCGAELYDHTVDPHETNNLASEANMASVRETLSGKLRAGWYAALPK